MYCSNCNKKGHTYSQCYSPITSLGIICIKSNYNIDSLIKNKIKKTDNINLKYLFICRKFSIGYSDFIRGKYNIKNLIYINKLLARITNDELDKLKKLDFDFLWKDLWSSNNKIHINNYKKAKYKFNKLVKNNLITILNNINIKYSSPEWELPKGRRKIKESDFDCANREFCEETNLNKKNYKILNLNKVVELFTGINNIHYKYIYYFAQSNSNVLLSSKNFHQSIEISNIKWVSIDEIKLILRDYQSEKLKLLNNINSEIIKL